MTSRISLKVKTGCLNSAVDAEAAEECCSSKSWMDSDCNMTPDNSEESSSEGERIRQRIAFHKGQGRAKSKRSEWSNTLVSREFQHWEE